jgi:hypothetical protein
MMDPIGVAFDKPIIQRKKPLNVILQIAAHYADTGAIFRGRLYWFPLTHRKFSLRTNSGSFATLAAIRRASSRVSSLAADCYDGQAKQ